VNLYNGLVSVFFRIIRCGRRYGRSVHSGCQIEIARGLLVIQVLNRMSRSVFDVIIELVIELYTGRI